MTETTGSPDTNTIGTEPASQEWVRASSSQTSLLAAFLMIVAALLVYTFLRLWPDVPNNQLAATFSAVGITFSPEIRMLLLVICAGGLGSFVHAATSLGDYAGNGRLGTNWFWWYVLRLPIGMVLALIIYAVIRGGMLAPGAGPENVSGFGMAAIGFLSGMFAKQATDKLDEIFKTLFKTSPASGDAQRKDKLSPTPPGIRTITPSPARVGVSMLTIDGTSFTDTTFLLINGRQLGPKLISPTQLTVDLPAELQVAGTLTVKAIDGGLESAPVNVEVVA